MKTKYIILTSTFIITIAVSTFAIVTMDDSDDCKSEIIKRYPYNKTSTIESYVNDCSIEFKKRIQFAIDKPAFAKLHYIKATKPSRELSALQTDKVLAILNDTASYIWGEIGTPYYDCYFTFHDREGNCIGYTDFSFEGQTYSLPNLAKMKWGMLSDAARAALITAIKDKD